MLDAKIALANGCTHEDSRDSFANNIQNLTTLKETDANETSNSKLMIYQMHHLMIRLLIIPVGLQKYLPSGYNEITIQLRKYLDLICVKERLYFVK